MILRCSWVTHGSLFQCDFAVVLLICHCQAGHAIASLEWYFAISRSLLLMYFWAGQLSAHGAALRNYGTSRSCVLLGVGLSIISPRRVYSRTCKLICRSSVHFANGQRETAQPRRLPGARGQNSRIIASPQLRCLSDRVERSIFSYCSAG